MEPSPAHGAFRPIRRLREQVARKIAAGEVIDRPYSVVRELIDNALDARADSVDVWLEDGGRSRIQVVDNGIGMDDADLQLCFLPYATSKIENEYDLENVTSLGFRGEALSSIATVARLEISSGRGNDGAAHRLVVHAGRQISFQPCEAITGTSVTVNDLFYSLPARRKFLKRASAETTMCRNAVVDKAVAFPAVLFRLFVDGELRLFLPPSDAEQRVLACYPELGARSLLSTAKGSGDGFSIEAVTAGSALLRRDRRLMQVFVNRRRVWEFALVQAMQYAFEAVAPGGSYPICFLFVRCEPQLVDFNIHPAKREVRFQNLAHIHRRTVETLSGIVRAATVRNAITGQASGSDGIPERAPSLDHALFDRGAQSGSARRAVADVGVDVIAESPAASHCTVSTATGTGFGSDGAHVNGTAAGGAAPTPAITYIGRLFGLFLLVSRGDRLYIVDQHAAHERLLYDRFRADRTLQELLVPLVVEVSEQEEQVLLTREQEVAELGIRLERSAPGQWRITAAAAAFLSHQDQIVESLREITHHPEQISRRFYAQMACRAAIKQGDDLDPHAAVRLLHQVFALPEPRCPHGRPLWAVLSRDQLCAMVGRS
ncbi:MAG: DNA mismatch repair endonuclease MutL [Spirochaetaceae bacterium]|nr:MAG: DNA mismatch repair endonuclease MutL [Spirochaetaceae bacterium]